MSIPEDTNERNHVDGQRTIEHKFVIDRNFNWMNGNNVGNIQSISSI